MEVADQLLQIFNLANEKEKYLEFYLDRNVNDKRYHIDSDKMLKLGWKPEVSWEEGLRRTGKNQSPNFFDEFLYMLLILTFI